MWKWSIFWCILESGQWSEGSKKNWAGLVRKIYAVDLLFDFPAS